VVVYLITFAVVILPVSLAGWWTGRRLPDCAEKLSFKSGACLIGLGIFWLAAAWLARPYADTDGFGSTVAEWFAFSGKWWVLLACAMFMHGLASGLKQIPRSWLRRVFYFAAMLLLAGLVVSRTLPVYFLLGSGTRDANGYLVQSKDYEYTCGAVALVNYLEQFRGVKGLTEREVSKICGVTVEGSTTTALVRAAHIYGLTNATALVINWPELEQLGHPVIVSISTLPQVHHATLLIRMDAQQVYFIDPAYGSWSASRERFREIWYGKTILLE
jgi:Peptidase C39 family